MALKCISAFCSITLCFLLCLVACLYCTAAYCSGMSPINPTINGTTYEAMTEHGSMIYHFTSPDLPCSHEKTTIFGNAHKTLSTNDKYNVVVPTGGSFAAIGAHFADKDFCVSDQGEYSYWTYNDSTYDVTSSGYPLQTNILTDVYGSSVGSLGVSGNMTGVAPDKYPVTITVHDNGSVTENGVVDGSVNFDFDLWVIDLAEKSGTISIPNGRVYEIDLTAIPEGFPHEDICYINVSWFGMSLPAQG